MSSWDMKIIASEADRLIAMSAQDTELRAALRVLAKGILEATEDRSPLTTAVGPVLAEATDVPASSSITSLTVAETVQAAPIASEPDDHNPEVAASPTEPLRELTLGRYVSPANPPSHPGDAGPPPDSREDEDDELERIEQRCRAKCEAVRSQAECHRRLWEGVESPVEDTLQDPELLGWASQLVDCFYWLDEDSGQSSDLSMLDDVGGCFEAVAEATRLLSTSKGRRGGLERALPLAAEAQSMLRRALQRLRAPSDPDQLVVYQILRDAAARERIFVKRHLRADDPADPSAWPGLLSRIEAVAASGQQSKQQKERIERLRERLESIRRGDGTDDDWQTVIELVEEAIADGIPPSNREIRDLLLPAIDELPEHQDPPPGFQLVLREMDRYLATRTSSPKATQSHVPPAEVKEAARLLDGRSVVLIGGIRRRESQDALRRAFRLKDLIWIETKEHQSIEPFEPVVARSDVALVLLAIRWSSHAFGDVRQFCVRHAKPLVRLPGGYGPHQVAVQILAQASELLRDD
jgi:hypothetical protein